MMSIRVLGQADSGGYVPNISTAASHDYTAAQPNSVVPLTPQEQVLVAGMQPMLLPGDPGYVAPGRAPGGGAPVTTSNTMLYVGAAALTAFLLLSIKK